MYQPILLIHIIAGFISLGTAFVAVLSKSFNMTHKAHVISGKVYFAGMTTVFVTAVIMAFIKPNVFLLLIAIFSYYLTLTGWRFAKNRKGVPTSADYAISGIMALASIGMIGLGTWWWLIQGISMGITILVFGIIGAGFCLGDLRRFRDGGVKGKERIVNHLNTMMGASIATLTAFVVTNFTMEPQFVLWLAPTVLITPIIAWWTRSLRAGKKVKGL